MSKPTDVESNPTSSPRKHVVITGTGRAGTTFLIEVLTILGLDTGFNIEELSSGK